MKSAENLMSVPTIETEKKPAKVLRGMPEFFEMREGKEQMETDKHPDYLMMNLETNCSYGCDKCALAELNRGKGPSLSLEERKFFLEVANNAGVKELVIIGDGEPTLLKNFTKIIKPLFEFAHEKGMGTVMFTTAVGIDKKQAEFYRDHDITVFVSLDSLNPDVYRKLTKTGDLNRVLKNIQILRDVYKDTPEILPDGRKLIRLAINVTIQKGNVNELEKIKEFAGDDMQFIVNAPMPQGKFRIYKNWEEFVGDGNLEKFKQLASEKSETGSHSSVAEGACSYFNRGISVDSDGQLLTCGYASESAHHLGNVREGITPEKLIEHYQEMRKKYMEWCQKIGRKPSCPLRDDDYENYIESLGGEKSK